MSENPPHMINNNYLKKIFTDSSHKCEGNCQGRYTVDEQNKMASILQTKHVSCAFWNVAAWNKDTWLTKRKHLEYN